MASAQSKKEPSVLKKHLGTIVASIITSILTLVISSAYKDFTEKKPKLLYEVLEHAVFKNENKKLGIYIVQIGNSGTRMAEDVQVVFNFSELTKISEFSINPSSNTILFTIQNDTIVNRKTVFFSTLNSSEHCKFSFFVENTKDIDLSVELRGKGFIGKPRPTLSEEFSDIATSTMFIIISIFIIILVIMLIASKIKKEMPKYRESSKNKRI